MIFTWLEMSDEVRESVEVICVVKKKHRDHVLRFAMSSGVFAILEDLEREYQEKDDDSVRYDMIKEAIANMRAEEIEPID